MAQLLSTQRSVLCSAGTWTVSEAYKGHTASVEDIQWSPCEATVRSPRHLCLHASHYTLLAMIGMHDMRWHRCVSCRQVFASGSVDRSIRIWDTRDRSKAQLVVPAHDAVRSSFPLPVLVVYSLVCQVARVSQAKGWDHVAAPAWSDRT